MGKVQTEAGYSYELQIVSRAGLKQEVGEGAASPCSGDGQDYTDPLLRSFSVWAFPQGTLIHTHLG